MVVGPPCSVCSISVLTELLIPSGPVVTVPPGSIDCTNQSLPISGSWTVETRVCGNLNTYIVLMCIDVTGSEY